MPPCCQFPSQVPNLTSEQRFSLTIGGFDGSTLLIILPPISEKKLSLMRTCEELPASPPITIALLPRSENLLSRISSPLLRPDVPPKMETPSPVSRANILLWTWLNV